MDFWYCWFSVVWQLQVAFSHRQTFLWASVILTSFAVRSDQQGVTSFVRGHWLVPRCYRNLLRAFHSGAVDTSALRRRWTAIALNIFSPYLVRDGARVVLVGDGLKNPKEGRKMPGVKLCHQESTNNSKAEFAMAHSCQAISILAGTVRRIFAIPLSCRIHEGIVFSNRDKRTLLDKMLELIGELELSVPFLLLADAYYASGRFALNLLREGNHLLTRVRSTAVAFYPSLPSGRKKRGRPRLYGKKVKLRDLFAGVEKFLEAKSPVYGETDVVIRYLCIDLMWRPLGRLVRFVLVIHPNRGKWILMTTDLSMAAVRIIELYGLRFKIEVTFKQAIHVIGAFAYHFWMRAMKKIRRGSGTQYMHRQSPAYRNQVRRKVAAYELHIALGLIAQGLMQFLAMKYPNQIWGAFRGWMRTMRVTESPSERIVGLVLQERLPEYLMKLPEQDVLKKFLAGKIDWSRCPTYQLGSVANL